MTKENFKKLLFKALKIWILTYLILSIISSILFLITSKPNGMTLNKWSEHGQPICPYLSNLIEQDSTIICHRDLAQTIIFSLGFVFLSPLIITFILLKLILSNWLLGGIIILGCLLYLAILLLVIIFITHIKVKNLK